MDMVAHCGKSVAGSHVHSLVMTDIASGWTEAYALVVREQTLIVSFRQACVRRLGSRFLLFQQPPNRCPTDTKPSRNRRFANSCEK